MELPVLRDFRDIFPELRSVSPGEIRDKSFGGFIYPVVHRLLLF
jgi:hypothetical protein